jgi:DNA-binding CsgD family transcriptional regulator
MNYKTYLHLDMAVFVKNLRSEYLWANDFFIVKSAGLQSMRDIYGKTDTTFSWRDYADNLTYHDQKLFETKQELVMLERIVRHDGRCVDIVSKKQPLYDQNQHLIGLIGFSMELPKSPELKLLSPREFDIVTRLSEGDTDKEIAKRYKISARTVETHIQHAKQKCHVKTRNELIALFSRFHP